MNRDLFASSVFASEEALFVAAVLVGSATGLVAGQFLPHWVSGATAGNIALALATTVTGATHSRLVCTGVRSVRWSRVWWWAHHWPIW